MQQRGAELSELNRASRTGFRWAANMFCDEMYEVSTKQCIEHQISKWIVDIKTKSYIRNE